MPRVGSALGGSRPPCWAKPGAARISPKTRAEHIRCKVKDIMEIGSDETSPMSNSTLKRPLFGTVSMLSCRRRAVPYLNHWYSQCVTPLCFAIQMESKACMNRSTFDSLLNGHVPETHQRQAALIANPRSLVARSSAELNCASGGACGQIKA